MKQIIQKIGKILKLLKLIIINVFLGRISSLNFLTPGLESLPAIPFKVRIKKNLDSLERRVDQTQQAAQGLNREYTIDDKTLPAHAFMWSPKIVAKTPKDPDVRETDEAVSNIKSVVEEEMNPFLFFFGADEEEELVHHSDRSAEAREDLEDGIHNPFFMAGQLSEIFAEEAVEEVQAMEERLEDVVAKRGARQPDCKGLSLEKPEQFGMAWTNFPDVYGDARPLLEDFSKTLTDVETADQLFWEIISEYGMPYNLLFLEKVDDLRWEELSELFGSTWNEEITDEDKGRLYVIDLRIFERFSPQESDGCLFFTPSSVAVLRQDAESKALFPVLIRVTGFQGRRAQIYGRHQATPSAWLYGLQAVKASIGTYGIWLGHVYHWHLPTAAVQMTMYNNLPKEHDLFHLLHPQSQYLIEFDTILLLAWSKVAPPTSITKAGQFLELENAYAEGRTFFDDDPTTTLEKNGIRSEDFSSEESWDRYQFVGRLLELWEITGDYVTASVNALYPDDQAVRDDKYLQRWMKDTSDPAKGNIRGLPDMDSRESLRRFLHSYLYRITAHGSSRLPSSANPGLTFVPNFPPCLQRTDIPSPDAELSTQELLTYLPNTTTIGAYLSFFYIFSFSTPSASVIPPNGIRDELFFRGKTERGKECNKAQIRFRKRIRKFIETYQPGSPQVTQWARNVET